MLVMHCMVNAFQEITKPVLKEGIVVVMQILLECILVPTSRLIFSINPDISVVGKDSKQVHLMSGHLGKCTRLKYHF